MPYFYLRLTVITAFCVNEKIINDTVKQRRPREKPIDLRLQSWTSHKLFGDESVGYLQDVANMIIMASNRVYSMHWTNTAIKIIIKIMINIIIVVD